jgi:hypothetical protein
VAAKLQVVLRSRTGEGRGEPGSLAERPHKDCKYCGDNILSSGMSSHLKQKHADEVTRKEKQLCDNAAHCFGNAGKPQTKGTRGKDGVCR